MNIRIPIGCGRVLVAESGVDPNYPRELYVGIEDASGAWIQDLVVVMNKYDYDDSGQVEYLDDMFKVLVYGDSESEDSTQETIIGLRKDLL